MKIRIFISTVCFVFCSSLFTSCATKKDLLYINAAPNTSATNINWSEMYIQPNDIVSVKITAESVDMAAAYNIATSQGTLQGGQMLLQGYLVTNNGTINIPVLGQQNIGGLTLLQAEKQIQKELIDKDYLKNPVVVCRLLNAKCTVLGEVNTPGTFTFFENNLTLLQALGLAGDLTINGVRKKITIIRTEKGVQTYGTIDLTKNDWFDTPFYFVKPNDVIIVDPNTAKVKSSGIITNPASLISLFSILLSSYIIIKNI